MLRCQRCGLVFSKEVIDPCVLRTLYGESLYTYQDAEPYIRRTYVRYLKRVLPMISSAPRPLSYLDVGAGNGFMLLEAKKLGFEHVWGVEPSADAIAQAHPSVRENMLQGFLSGALLGGRKFDVMTCFQVLDHCSDPLSFVSQCREALKPGGIILCINHDIASWSARLLGERCPMIDIEHTFLHTPQTMRQLFASQGFHTIHVFPIRNDYPLWYWFSLLPFPVRWKKSMMTRIRRSKAGNMLLPLYAGNLCLIACV